MIDFVNIDNNNFSSLNDLRAVRLAIKDIITYYTKIHYDAVQDNSAKFRSDEMKECRININEYVNIYERLKQNETETKEFEKVTIILNKD